MRRPTQAWPENRPRSRLSPLHAGARLPRPGQARAQDGLCAPPPALQAVGHVLFQARVLLRHFARRSSPAGDPLPHEPAAIAEPSWSPKQPRNVKSCVFGCTTRRSSSLRSLSGQLVFTDCSRATIPSSSRFAGVARKIDTKSSPGGLLHTNERFFQRRSIIK